MKCDLIPIRDLVNEYVKSNGESYIKYSSGWKLKPEKDKDLPSGINKGGIYVFWWLNNSVERRRIFLENIHPFNLKGKQYTSDKKIVHHEVPVKIDNNWLNYYEEHIPLYVGKTDGSIYKRINQHLKINQKKYSGKTTSDQLRRGIETLFNSCNDTAKLIVENIGLSYINLHSYDEAINRFYLENYNVIRMLALGDMFIGGYFTTKTK